MSFVEITLKDKEAFWGRYKQAYIETNKVCDSCLHTCTVLYVDSSEGEYGGISLCDKCIFDHFKKIKETNSIIEAMRPQWLPISSAPKDGRFILIFVPQEFNHGIYIAYWCRDHFQAVDTTWIGKDLPTHWQPLPEPPKL